MLEVTNSILRGAKEQNAELRILGGVGVYLMCPQWQQFLELKRSPFSDIDVLILRRDVMNILQVFGNIGLDEDVEFRSTFGRERRVFYTKENLTIDMFIDNVSACQEVPIGNRIRISYPTLSPTDMLLTKLQKIGLADKDRIDICVLLLSFTFENSNEREFNINRIARLCSSDWRWWKTIETSLRDLENRKTVFESEHERTIDEKLLLLKDTINSSKKTLRWKARSFIGERIPWYEHIDEIEK